MLGHSKRRVKSTRPVFVVKSERRRAAIDVVARADTTCSILLMIVYTEC